MSKADTLGPPTGFGTTRRSARRDAIAKTVGGEQAAAEAVAELPLTVISDNPDNPRDHLRNLDDTVQNIREVGVLLPIIVATTDAYLAPRPGRAGDLEPGAQYVVVDGHRRLEAARRVGLATIPVRVDNARVATDEALLEAAFVANYHRDDMTDLEEATALQSLVDFYGSQTKAAKRLGMTQSVISSKLSLLKLTPALQADLLEGKRTVEQVRNLGKLSPEEQRQKADERAQLAAARAAAQRTPPAPVQQEQPPAPVKTTDAQQQSGPADYHGVIIPGKDSQQTPAPPAPTNPPPAPFQKQGLETVPEPRPVPEPTPEANPETIPEGRKLPYDDGPFIGQHLTRKMDEASFVEAVQVMTTACWDKAGPGPSFDILRSMLETAEERDRDKLLPLLRHFLPDMVDRSQA